MRCGLLRSIFPSSVNLTVCRDCPTATGGEFDEAFAKLLCPFFVRIGFRTNCFYRMIERRSSGLSGGWHFQLDNGPSTAGKRRLRRGLLRHRLDAATLATTVASAAKSDRQWRRRHGYGVAGGLSMRAGPPATMWLDSRPVTSQLRHSCKLIVV